MGELWRLVRAPKPVFDDVVRQELLAQAGRASQLSSLLGVSLVLLVVPLLVVGGAAAGQVVLWGVVCLTVTLLYGVAIGRFVVPDSARRSYRSRLRTYALSQVLCGLVWGSLPIIVEPAGGQQDVVTIAALTTAYAVVTNVVFASPTPVPWVCFHISALAASSAGMLIHDEASIAALNLLTLLAALPLSKYTYHRVAEARLDARAKHLLAAELREEREAVEQVNLQLSEANSELRHQATRDPLTGLPNRSLFFANLVRAMRHGRRAGRPVSVIFFDLDRFKAVNDSLGHGAGDDLLRQVADRTSAVLRSPDVLARLGGDEFVVLTHDLTGGLGEDAPVQVAERIRRVLAAPFQLAGMPVSLSSSLGVATDESGLSGDDLVERADLALYRAKEAGRNQVAVFRPELLRGQSPDGPNVSQASRSPLE